MKRKRQNRAAQRENKRQKLEKDAAARPTHPLLRCYYPEVVTLRQYLASRLGTVSKRRQKRVQQYGRDGASPSDRDLVELLDRTVIGSFNRVFDLNATTMKQDLNIFTQQLSASVDRALTPGEFKQAEIVDFAIWLLFRRRPATSRPQHLLCQGLQRHSSTKDGSDPLPVPGVPGLYSVNRNKHVETLKQRPWTAVPDLLGQGAECILTDLFIECGVYAPIGGRDNLYQLCGTPMHELKASPKAVIRSTCHAEAGDSLRRSEHRQRTRLSSGRSFSEVRLLRNRILYAKASINSKNCVTFGLPKIHVLNRYRNVNSHHETSHIMKYIFPRQFGLHNAFTSVTDPQDTAQLFKDYTLRDREIFQLNRHRLNETKSEECARITPVPRRLRGKALDLVGRLRRRHLRCPFRALLEHYCPHSQRSDGISATFKQASTPAQVSAFCRAVIRNVFPKEFWGDHDTASVNMRVLERNIDDYIRFRRFESLTVHDVLQNLKLAPIPWLIPPKVLPSAAISVTDLEKRRELMAELLYYLIDSFLHPLIRGHFYVTETTPHRNQLFYFRHDIWMQMSEPALTQLKHDMLEESASVGTKRLLATRALGVSGVRLLPKEIGMRPIINLRRRVQRLKYGRPILGKSINGLLSPVFSVLNFEKFANPRSLGSALLSTDDLFPRLQTYRQYLKREGLLGQRLYFAKVDVRACFDTIPQKQLLLLVDKLLSADRYQISRYSRAKLVGGQDEQTASFGAKPSWKFLTKAKAGSGPVDFHHEILNDTMQGRTKTVYIDGITQKEETRGELMKLLQEHVQSNLIKIGPQFYRQKEGIPQGSIVSSLLCSYFYADLEREFLSFVNNGCSIMLRLIDDFLVISTDREITERFMRVMHAGIPEYGINVKAEKSRANFQLAIPNVRITQLPEQAGFPYCGNMIDPVTLDLSKDRERRRTSNIPDSVTVEYSKQPGQTFYRKALSALKLQMHAMLLSTKYNSLQTVLGNLYHSFSEVAQKCYHYIKALPPVKRPTNLLIIRSVDALIKLACVLLRRRNRTSTGIMSYECAVSNSQARWLACTAFLAVFGRRQTKHARFLAWLQAQIPMLAMGGREQRGMLEQAVEINNIRTDKS